MLIALYPERRAHQRREQNHRHTAASKESHQQLADARRAHAPLMVADAFDGGERADMRHARFRYVERLLSMTRMRDTARDMLLMRLF